MKGRNYLREAQKQREEKRLREMEAKILFTYEEDGLTITRYAPGFAEGAEVSLQRQAVSVGNTEVDIQE